MDGIEDESAKHFLSPCSSDIGSCFRDPQACPRIGDEYQAKIPPLVGECTHLQLNLKPTDKKVKDDVSNSFLLGLPIPILWSYDKVEKAKQHALEVHGNQVDAVNTSRTIGSVDSEKSQASSYRRKAKVFIDLLEEERKGGLVIPHPTTGGEKVDMELVSLQESRTELDQMIKGLYPLPGLVASSWTAFDVNSLILGLYVFGKNFLCVKEFMERKGMGDILSFYYGKFYQSDAYRRWTSCRKVRGRHSVHGHRMFAGWRQQELLSRIFSQVSEQCKRRLVEVSRTFAEGKFSLQEYVCVLKNVVGLKLLVEAVGLGKGRQDLTVTPTEPMKTDRVFSVHPEIPVGKACSSLTSGEIIKFLTGDFWLSKTRSSDLFWEAVWPRLLAKGWHSEQPNQGSSVSKNSLVFLIPGIKKFSRRELVKGNHYFDSVTDILTKVVSDPGLIELEIEAAKGSKRKEEYRWDAHIEEDMNGISNQQRHCYLQPPTSNCCQDLKFTIVDTSFIHGGKQSKVIELKSLPIDTTNIFTDHSLFSVTEENTLGGDEDEDKLEETNSSPSTENVADRGACCQSNSPDTCEKMVVQVVLSQNISSASSAKGSPDEGNEGIVSENCPITVLSPGKPEPHPLFDLNVLPNIPPEFEIYDSLSMQTVANHVDLGAHESSAPPETSQQPKPPKLSDDEAGIEQQPVMNVRRHSTRNRLLSTKALEALACGFFKTTRKRRGVEALTQNNSMPRSSRRVRGRTAASGTLENDFGNNLVDSRTRKEGVAGTSGGNAKVVDESQK